eukprot:CAMPEP_0113942858 /NCGR_PEP_ID=MMETSP1339-20121228/13141_1 /TAXON_ID=94617 /ORGANISM="Fibrocapsa japonica" /LENGTH=177 /DNA_ID=CAMNT_0000947519 /DNA_START=41 /DNA_END=574 /DNA_ORIENTATION=+ /assembly_acc=CAM_ASM_000762
MKLISRIDYSTALILLLSATTVYSFSAMTPIGKSQLMGRTYTILEHFKAQAPAKSSSRSMSMMPSLLVQSNVVVDEEKEDAFLKEASSMVANGLGKPESYVMVSLKFAKMSFGGSKDPCAFVDLISLGRIEPDLNKEMSSKISELMNKHFGIPKNRLYVQFFDSPRENFGFNGSTFG